MNQKGHGDYGAILGLMFLAAIIPFVIEVIFVVLTFVLWKYLFFRILFAILAIGGAAFIVLNVWDYIR